MAGKRRVTSETRTPRPEPRNPKRLMRVPGAAKLPPQGIPAGPRHEKSGIVTDAAFSKSAAMIQRAVAAGNRAGGSMHVRGEGGRVSTRGGNGVYEPN